MLSKLALGKGKGRFDTVIQVTLSGPTISDTDCMNVKVVEEYWRKPIMGGLKALAQGEVIPDNALAKNVPRYVFIGGDLYKRGFTTPLLKCVGKELIDYMMNVLHNGVCGMHCDHRTLASRVIWAGYYWPTSAKTAQNM